MSFTSFQVKMSRTRNDTIELLVWIDLQDNCSQNCRKIQQPQYSTKLQGKKKKRYIQHTSWLLSLKRKLMQRFQRQHTNLITEALNSSHPPQRSAEGYWCWHREREVRKKREERALLGEKINALWLCSAVHRPRWNDKQSTIKCWASGTNDTWGLREGNSSFIAQIINNLSQCYIQFFFR